MKGLYGRGVKEGIDDFWVAIGKAAQEKDIAKHGPNVGDVHRSLHDITFEMHELLRIYGAVLKEKGVEML